MWLVIYSVMDIPTGINHNLNLLGKQFSFRVPIRQSIFLLHQMALSPRPLFFHAEAGYLVMQKSTMKLSFLYLSKQSRKNRIYTHMIGEIEREYESWLKDRNMLYL